MSALCCNEKHGSRIRQKKLTNIKNVHQGNDRPKGYLVVHDIPKIRREPVGRWRHTRDGLQMFRFRFSLEDNECCKGSSDERKGEHDQKPRRKSV